MEDTESLGWIKLHRGLINSWQFADPTVLRIWLWILCKANFSDSFFTIRSGSGERIIKVKRGQMIFGRKAAAKELNLHESNVYRVIQALASDGCILVESNNQFSIITVVKYDEYQSNEDIEEIEIIPFRTPKEQPVNNPRTACEQPADSVRTHYKKVNNVKNVNKVKKEQPILFRDSVYFDFELFKMQFFGIEKYEVLSLEDYHENALNWSNGKGEKRLDWIATVKNWMNRDLKNKTSTNGTAKINGSGNGFTHKSERANDSYRELRATDKGTGEHPYD